MEEASKNGGHRPNQRRDSVVIFVASANLPCTAQDKVLRLGGKYLSQPAPLTPAVSPISIFLGAKSGRAGSASSYD